MRTIITASMLAVLLLGLITNSVGSQSSSFIVIVNKSNPVEHLDKNKISKIFLKKITKWDNDWSIDPVDLPASSNVRAVFSKEIHDKTESMITSYWQRMIFSGRSVPPLEKKTDAEVIAYVQSNRGAISYVSRQTSVSEVKEIRIDD